MDKEKISNTLAEVVKYVKSLENDIKELEVALKKERNKKVLLEWVEVKHLPWDILWFLWDYRDWDSIEDYVNRVRRQVLSEVVITRNSATLTNSEQKYKLNYRLSYRERLPNLYFTTQAEAQKEARDKYYKLKHNKDEEKKRKAKEKLAKAEALKKEAEAELSN